MAISGDILAGKRTATKWARQKVLSLNVNISIQFSNLLAAQVI